MKKILIVIMMVFCLAIFAEEENNNTEVENNPKFGMGGTVGSISINGDIYSRIRLMPELTLGKFGVGLDIDLLIDSDGNIYEEDWDEWEDYVAKILYLRYGFRGDPIYGKFGSFAEYTLGHGLIVHNYTNMLRYPEFRQLGLQIGFNTPYLGFGAEFFTPNIVETDILISRAHFSPLINTNTLLLSGLKIGGSFVIDKDQYAGLTQDEIDAIDFDSDEDGILDSIDMDDDGDGIIDLDALEGVANVDSTLYDDDVIRKKLELDKDKKITIVGVDYELPIVNNSFIKLSHYGEAAQIIDYGMGFIFPGFYAKFLIFHANLEFRHFEDEFLPGFFDNLYEANRVKIIGENAVTKDSYLKSIKASSGWYGSLTSDLFEMLYLRVAYQDMYGDDIEQGRSLWGDLWLNTENIPMIKIAKVSYMQTNVKDFTHFKSDNALLSAKLGYALSSNSILVYQYQELYRDINGNGKIESNKQETKKTVSFGVEFKF